jgi:hypothetical protein
MMTFSRLFSPFNDFRKQYHGFGAFVNGIQKSELFFAKHGIIVL